MGERKTVEVDARLKEVIRIATRIQACDLNKWKPVIMRARQDGVIRAAYELARNNN